LLRIPSNQQVLGVEEEAQCAREKQRQEHSVFVLPNAQPFFYPLLLFLTNRGGAPPPIAACPP
jgi:hypothetical protein